MAISKASRSYRRGSTRGSSPATGATVSSARSRASSTSLAALNHPIGETRATMSHGSRRATSLLESLRTTASSTARSSPEAADIAAATARRASADSIFV